MPTELPPPPVRIQVLVGPAVPVPLPREVLEDLRSASVVTTSGTTQSGFELVFDLSPRSPLHTLFLVTGGANIPFVRVVIAVTVAGSTEVLVDGVMTHHQVTGSGQDTRLVVKGKDLTAAMDVIPLDGVPYPAMPPAARVGLALVKYAVFGCVPLVIPSLYEDVPLPIDRIPRHQGTDYAYVRALAEEVGHVFYVEPGPAIGTSRAYWGPEIRLGAIQPALNLGLGTAHDNVTSLEFRFDKEAKELPIVHVQEQVSKVPIPIPIPDVTPLNPMLGLIPPLPPKVTHLRDTAKDNPVVAVMKGIGHAARHSDSVFGSGSLDVARYGRVLRARQLVGVRGAGPAFDGVHYVTSVTHQLERGSYTQSFQLARNALLSTVPRVPV